MLYDIFLPVNKNVVKFHYITKINCQKPVLVDVGITDGVDTEVHSSLSSDELVKFLKEICLQYNRTKINNN